MWRNNKRIIYIMIICDAESRGQFRSLFDSTTKVATEFKWQEESIDFSK